MKSSEQPRENPEQPKEPEYDKLAWNKLKQEKGPGIVMKRGRELGVPLEELDNFAKEVIAKRTKEGDYKFAFDFRKNTGIGTREELRAIGARAYQFYYDNGDFGLAMSLAEDVYGRDSEEWKCADKANETKREQAERRAKEREPEIVLPRDATFADLFAAIDEIEERGEAVGVGDDFEEMLYDNFDPEIADEVLSFQEAEQAGKAASTKVIDFFKDYEYLESEILALLPIKFKK